MTSLLPLLLALACVPSPAPGTPPTDPLDGPDPSLVGVTWACDVDTGSWTFTLEADAWTGGGLVYMGTDAATMEEHRVRSVEAAAEGDADRLELILAIVADWRDAAPGSSTRWRCVDEDELAFQAAIYEVTGETVTDCRFWGTQPELWQVVGDGISDCTAPLPVDTAQ